MGRYDESDEGYYEDDGEFVEEQPRLSQRVVAVFTGSYGISIALHVALLLVLATIVIASPPKDEPAVINVCKMFLPPKPKIDDMAERDIKAQQEVPLPEVDVPVVDLIEEPQLQEVPKGVETNVSNKNLDLTSYDDTVGIAGAGAGAVGRLDGIGKASRFGGGKGTVNVVDAGLRWLASHQSPNGSWDSDGWKANCKRGPTCTGPGHDEGGSTFDVGVTGLALLAFMGQGHTSNHGHFKRTVKKGMRWLQTQQRADGSLGFEPGAHGGMYNHAMATMALCEGYGLRDLRLRGSAGRAVKFCLDAQNPGLGWKYGVRDGRNDTSVTGWMVLALKAAKVAGIEVPKSSFAGAKRWIHRSTSSDGAAGYEGPGGTSSVLTGQEDSFDPLPTMTSVALVCRLFAGEKTRDDSMRKGARLIAASPPEWKPRRTNFYYWYYGTYALFHFNDAKWTKWNVAMKKALMPTQRKGGCEDGSWDGVGEWCPAGGRVYATSINVLTLEIYYRYKRMTHAK